MTAFLMTWKETGWPHENILQMVATLEAQGYVDEPWRIAAHRRKSATVPGCLGKGAARREYSVSARSQVRQPRERQGTAKYNGWRLCASTPSSIRPNVC